MQPAQPRIALRGTLFGPILVGIAYGVATFLPRGLGANDLYVQSPFTFTILSGVAIALACRPVLFRIPWRRGVAVGLAVALLAGVGPSGDWIAAALQRATGVGVFPLNLPESLWSLLLSAAVGGVAMGLLFRPPGGAIDAGDLWARFRFGGVGGRLARLAAVAVLVVLFSLAAGWLDARLESRTIRLYLPLVQPNPWLQLEGIWLRTHNPTGLVGAGLLLGILWLRGLALLAPLLPIALAVRGSRHQLTLVFTILLFVLSEFAPLMVDQPYPSLQWLAARTGLGLLRAVVLGLAMAIAFGLTPSRRDSRPVPTGGDPKA